MSPSITGHFQDNLIKLLFIIVVYNLFNSNMLSKKIFSIHLYLFI